MLMLRKTHREAMQVADAEARYEARRAQDDYRAELDRQARRHVQEIASVRNNLEHWRGQVQIRDDTIRNLQQSLELTAKARDEAVSQFNALVLGPAPFKWGADPAPEAKRANLVDRAMALTPFPVIFPDFASLETRVHACTGWGPFDSSNPLRYVPAQIRYPYAGPTTGRMPGAGSVKP